MSHVVGTTVKTERMDDGFYTFPAAVRLHHDAPSAEMKGGAREGCPRDSPSAQPKTGHPSPVGADSKPTV